MPMLRCSQGHFYDDAKHSSCPWCGVPNLDVAATTPAGGDDGAPRTMAIPRKDNPVMVVEEARTIPLLDKERVTPGLEGKTVALVRKQTGIDPVVGWLVCVEGVEKGRDFRIRSEKNRIGRAESMDIVLKGDTTISRENHAYVVFNPKKNTFRVEAGEGRGLIYVNDEEVVGSAEISAYDIIEIGECKYSFVPFCGERFSWKEEKNNAPAAN